MDRAGGVHTFSFRGQLSGACVVAEAKCTHVWWWGPGQTERFEALGMGTAGGNGWGLGGACKCTAGGVSPECVHSRGGLLWEGDYVGWLLTCMQIQRSGQCKFQAPMGARGGGGSGKGLRQRWHLQTRIPVGQKLMKSVGGLQWLCWP